MSNTAQPSARRILVGIAVIGFVVGGAAAAWRAVESEDRSTYAGLFSSQAIDLRLNGPAGVNGFLGSDNLAPGDRVSGMLRLSTKEPIEPGLADLDVKVETELRGPHGIHSLDDALVLSRLAYGVDDLLSDRDGGRHATPRLDTNGDGWISVRELTSGIADLPQPAGTANGGTGLSVELTFQPHPEATSDDLAGQDLDVRFIFQLGDALAPDI